MLRSRIVVSGALACAALAGVAVMAGAAASAPEPLVVEISIHYSHFQPSAISVPAGRPVTFVIDNTDPIDHEWIVGDEAVHARHRTGTEPTHGARPTEQSIAPGGRVETIVTFAEPGVLTYVCHLPGHEAYGMVGTLTVVP